MRIRSVIKLHTANRFAAFGLPFMILGIALTIILAIGVVARLNVDAAGQQAMYEGMVWNGAVFSYLGPLMGFGFTAMGQYFPLASGLGLTRREFAAGTSLMFLGNAVIFGAVTTVGKVLEAASGGWWLNVRFFDVNYTGNGPWWVTLVQTTLLIAMVMFIGAAITTAFLRWGQLFLWLFLSALTMLVLVVVGSAILLPEFASWLLDVTQMGWLPWMAVVVALTGLGAFVWFTLVRRAQTR